MTNKLLNNKLLTSWIAVFLFFATCTGFLIGHSIYAAKINSVTVDEFIHLPAAISILQTGDLRLNHSSTPPLLSLAAIPSMYQNPVTNYNNTSWKHKRIYPYAWDFMLANMYCYQQLYFAPRMVVAGFAVLLAMLVFTVAGVIFGRGAAAIAALFICFSPEILAHASLVTPDVIFACFFLPLFISTCGSSMRPARLTSSRPASAPDLHFCRN
jgi:hypothetical protein